MSTTPMPGGGYLVPRAHLDPAQRCYTAFDARDYFLGFVQEYADGSAAYWFEPMQQAKSAASLEDAYARLGKVGDR